MLHIFKTLNRAILTTVAVSGQCFATGRNEGTEVV